jgi:NRPS condensation-like uncharacterized protein
MRTTVNLPDSLFKKSEAVAAARGTTVEDLILHAISKEVECDLQTPSGGSGLRVELPIIRSKHPGTLDLSKFDFDDLLA